MSPLSQILPKPGEPTCFSERWLGRAKKCHISGLIAYPDFFLELTRFFGFVGTAEAKTSGSSRWRGRPSRSVKVHTPRPVLGVIGSLRADVRSPVADKGIQ